MISISQEFAIFEKPIRVAAMKARMLAMSIEFLLETSENKLQLNLIDAIKQN